MASYLATVVDAGQLPFPDSLIVILDDWYLDVVRPELLAAAQPGATDLATVIALDEADLWASYIDISASAAATVRAGLGADIHDAERNAGAALRAAIDRANQTCLAQPTTTLGVTNAMRAANNAFFWELFGAPVNLNTGLPLPLQTLVDSLCLKIDYLSVTFPQQVVVGQTVPLVVRVGMLLGTQPVTTTDLLDIDVQPAGAIIAAGQPASGGNDANGFFSTQLTIQQAATVVNIESCANTAFSAQQLPYLRLCKDTLIVRNGPVGGSDLSGPWTGLLGGLMSEVTVAHDQATGRVTATFVGSSFSSGFNGSFAGTLSGPRLQNFSLTFNLFCLTTYTATSVNASDRQIDGFATGPDCGGTGTTTAQFRWVKLNGAPLVQGNYRCDGCADGVIGRADVWQFGDSVYVDAGPGLFAARLTGSTFGGTRMVVSGVTNCLLSRPLGGGGCTLEPNSTITGTLGGGSLSATVTTPQGTFQVQGTKQ